MGISDVLFANVILGDEWGDPLSATLASGTVSGVPEPNTMILLSSGLIGLVRLRRKFKR